MGINCNNYISSIYLFNNVITLTSVWSRQIKLFWIKILLRICLYPESFLYQFFQLVILVTFWDYPCYTDHFSLVTIHRLLFTGYFSIVTFHWLLFTGYLSLVTFHWLLFTDYFSLITFTFQTLLKIFNHSLL